MGIYRAYIAFCILRCLILRGIIELMSAIEQQINPDANVAMRSYIQRVATGPEYSKDISFEEARDAMQHILDGTADPVQAGIFLIALRMKRETLDENGGSLQAIIDASARRLRPILMTTLTTVFGVTPMALGIGEGAEIRVPLAITLIAGLSSSTLLTLVVIPCAYAVVNRDSIESSRKVSISGDSNIAPEFGA